MLTEEKGKGRKMKSRSILPLRLLPAEIQFASVHRSALHRDFSREAVYQSLAAPALISEGCHHREQVRNLRFSPLHENYSVKSPDHLHHHSHCHCRMLIHDRCSSGPEDWQKNSLRNMALR